MFSHLHGRDFLNMLLVLFVHQTIQFLLHLVDCTNSKLSILIQQVSIMDQNFEFGSSMLLLHLVLTGDLEM